MSKSLEKIHIVVGARPNYIKANPVYEALEALDRFELVLINTGQHYDHNMSTLFFHELGMKPPDVDLEVGSGTHGEQTGRILQSYEQILFHQSPDLVMVLGDVNSTVACSLAAVKLHIPVAHVEAGLRSFDRTMPEEINRVLTDQICQWLFTTSQECETNLNNEGISSQNIHFVGNTMIDSLVAFQEYFSASTIHEQLNLHRPYAVMTFHRPSNVDEDERLIALVEALEETSTLLDCVFPVHPRTRRKLEQSGLWQRLESNTHCHVLLPVGYIDFMRLQRDAQVVLTDSGGIQEETTFLGVPCLTVRDNTERPIAITQGTNKLIGTDYSVISHEVEMVLTKKRHETRQPELWDGHAAQRIAEVIEKGDLTFKSSR